MNEDEKEKKYKKEHIPKALREQVWIQTVGHRFKSKCSVVWCSNTMTVFDFHCAHNIPEKLGGATDLSNLVATCSRCNLSMGSQYSVVEWNVLGRKKQTVLQRWGTKVRTICTLLF